MSMNIVTLLYLAASICFIQALKGLSHPSTARRGNAFGMVGMGIALATTIALIVKYKAQFGANSGAHWLWLAGWWCCCGWFDWRHFGQARRNDQNA